MMTIGIIGFGRFGKLWADCCKRFGDVYVYDGNEGATTSSRLHFRKTLQSDLLFLLVPISQIESVCKEIRPHLLPDTIVADACSVKMHPAKMMKRWLPRNQPLIATHPLFGPDSVKRLGLKGRSLVVCPLRASPKQLTTFETLLCKMGLKIIRATPKQHDHDMATSQALAHFIGRGLEPLKLRPQLISTPDFDSLLRMNEMVHNDTRELFLDMQRYNPYSKPMRKQFLNFLKKLNHEIAHPS